MADLKYLADLVTTIRGFMAFILVWIGLFYGKEGLSSVVYIMLGCWTGDFIDGRIARLSQTKRQTWIGSHDLQVDLFVSLGLGGYLLWSGYVSKVYSIAYILVWGIILWWKGPDRNLLMLFQCPIYFTLIYLSLIIVPDAGKWILIWIGIILTLNWYKFSKEIVPGFVSGIFNLFKNNGESKIH